MKVYAKRGTDKERCGIMQFKMISKMVVLGLENESGQESKSNSDSSDTYSLRGTVLVCWSNGARASTLCENLLRRFRSEALHRVCRGWRAEKRFILSSEPISALFILFISTLGCASFSNRYQIRVGIVILLHVMEKRGKD